MGVPETSVRPTATTADRPHDDDDVGADDQNRVQPVWDAGEADRERTRGPVTRLQGVSGQRTDRDEEIPLIASARTPAGRASPSPQAATPASCPGT